MASSDTPQAEKTQLAYMADDAMYGEMTFGEYERTLMELRKRVASFNGADEFASELAERYGAELMDAPVQDKADPDAVELDNLDIMAGVDESRRNNTQEIDWQIRQMLALDTKERAKAGVENLSIISEHVDHWFPQVHNAKRSITNAIRLFSPNTNLAINNSQWLDHDASDKLNE